MSMKGIISGAVAALGLILAGQVASAAPVSPDGNVGASAQSALTAVKLGVHPGHGPAGGGGGGGLSIRPGPQMSFGLHPRGGDFHHGKHEYSGQRYLFGATIGLGLYSYADSCYWDCIGVGYKGGYCRSHYRAFCH